MSVSEPFIRRPIATSLLGIALMIGGALGYWALRAIPAVLTTSLPGISTVALDWRVVAFTSVLSLVPLATVAFALFTAFPIFGSFQASLQDFLAVHLMPPQINDQIFKYLNQFASKAKGLTTVGMIILFVTSVMTMMTVESAFNGAERWFAKGAAGRASD